MKTVIKKNRFLVTVLAVNLLVLALRPATGIAAFTFTGRNFLSFAVILAPIFILIGLMDVWIERELMIRMMGNRSGLRGALTAFLLGTVTAVPLYALLPVAGTLLRKGSRISNVLIFLGASAGVRIPLLLFEVSSLGWEFTVIRFIANIFAVFFIAFTVERLLRPKDIQQMYENASGTESSDV
jgi:uncharacterized membrane protein YraQ (UPF0718 family)